MNNMGSVALEEYELMKDAKYRLYVSAVDKALRYFESTNDWPDLISALGKLNKVLRENQRFPVIPRRIKISKRLAQCMHFALPSGVHLKALETYDIIFKCMGTNRLSHELFIYSAGLFPLLGHSAMNVKPALLTVYETHFVPLGQRLRPGLSGFLSGVLPGLEEGSDHFDRTNSLLEKVCEGVGSIFFYGCLWECLSCNSAIRLPAISFILSHFNKKLTMEDQIYIMGTDVDMMVNALCAGVQDNNVLVQRSSLDLLLVGFPMHSSHLIQADMISLVTAALTTILRRDMSLNRRLYAWLLGSEINISLLSPEHQFVKKMEESDIAQSSLYFDMYSREHLIQGVKTTLSQQGNPSPDIRPYRLLISLLDKQDVGSVILDDILFEVFRTLYLACKNDKCDGTKHKQEILKSANLLFSSLEPWYIWQYTGSLFDQACKLNIEELTTISEIEITSVEVRLVGSGPPNVWEVCELCEFLLNIIPLETCSDTPGEHLLQLVVHVVSQLTKYVDTLSQEQIARSLKLCAVILTKVQPLANCRKISRAESTSTESSLKSSKTELINAGVIRSRTGSDFNSTSERSNESLQFPKSEAETQSKFEPSNLALIFKSFLKHYEIFYVTLVGSGRIIHSTLVPEAFDKMRKGVDFKNENEKEYAEELRRILTAVMNEDDTSQVFYRRREEAEEEEFSMDVAVDGNEKWEDSFKIASEILVELSTFPKFFIEFDHNHNREENVVFSPWMKILVVCSCCLQKSPKLQLIAMTTLLELLSLSKLSTPNEKEGAASLLNASQVHFLEHNTNVIKIMAQILWRHLGNLTSDQQVTCIELIYQLHRTFSSNDSLEKVLGEALLHGTERGRVDALQRFTKLWHVGRELQTKDFRYKKLFHQCLLKLLDNLLLGDNSPLKIETQTWLIQSLMRGDIVRLLDPILLMLLDPATARMSILHVDIQHSSANVESQGQTNQKEDSCSKIYAISSVDGNVIYHVSDNISEKGTFPKRLKWRWKNKNNIIDRSNERVFAVTSLKNQGDRQPSYVTEKNVMRDIELPRCYSGNISVFVNPFVRGFPEDESCPEEDLRSETESQSDYATSDLAKNARRFNAATREMEPRHENGIEMDVLPRTAKITLEVTTSESPPSEIKFFNQLKSKLIDADQSECDESLSADEYFNQDKKRHISSDDVNLIVVQQVLDSLIDSVVKKCDGTKSESVITKPGVGVHRLHSHLLLYCGVYDSCRTLYAFNTLKNVLLTNSRLFLCCAATSGIINAPVSSDLLLLLARHRKSVFGRSFHGDVNSLSDYMSTYRSSMYLEILVSICLYFARSYYPNLGLLRLTADEIAGNRQVQLTSVEVLTHLFTELIPIVRDSGKGFANYIADMLMRCKVQKIVLHCVMSSLHSIEQQQNSSSSESKTFTEEIIDFNDPRPRKGNSNASSRLTEHSEALQIQLLKLLLALIMLEQQVECQKGDPSEITQATKDGAINSQESFYSPGCLIPQQPMFLKALMTALKLKGLMRFLHYNWTYLITASLPYLGAALPQVITITINQLCVNVEELATVYSSRKCSNEECLPADYAVMQLEALTVLSHYCVLDSTQQISPQPLASGIGSNLPGASGSNPVQILNNLVHVFTPIPLTQDFGKERNQEMETHLNVRRSVLSNMPRIISSVGALWHAITDLPGCDTDVYVWGNPRVVKNQILEFLSPISLHHGANFLAAIAVAWQERKETEAVRRVLPVASRNQQVLVDLVSAIRVMPIDTLVQTVHVVVKQPPAIHGASQDVSLDVSVLELFYVYMQTTTGVQLGESWTSLLGLLRDGLVLSPPALFLILAILNEFVQKCSPFQEKKDQRDLQEITLKLVEVCGTVAGACLEQTTWLRRNFSVKEDLDLSDEESSPGPATSLQQHSVHAQLVLAQILAPLLDVSYGSQEKEKVAALLTSLMYNITPYLKNHLPKNAASFQACSQLLANLSGFQYTRKAWKRDVFELLLEPSLFQMEMECLSNWTTIIDNLMTHDMTTFRDLMGRISVAQSGSYSLFSSREQEYEQRSQLLKRLAFVIFCSEADQYHKFMPNIQERLSESLRLPQVVPSVQAQVFFCFRVLLLRMSSHHVTSLWPIIISEMVQVFMHIEQELSTDSEEFSSHIKLMSALDSSWVVNSSNGLHAHGHPHWLQLTLAAAKLLDLAVLLPAQHLPQFQMYRWAFVNNHTPSSTIIQEDDAFTCHDFVSHVMRISRLMDAKYGPIETALNRKEGHLLIEATHLDSLQQLHPFFTSLGLYTQSSSVNMEAIEKSMLNDFLEKISAKVNH